MHNLELIKQLRRLESLVEKTNYASANDFELQSHWGRYVCVLISGFLENALSEIYTEYVQKAASPPVANFTVSILSRIQNPRASRFIETAQAFKKVWGEELEEFMIQNGRKDAIDSIMNNRHQIAHGKDSGITVARANNYLKKCVEVIDFIETQCRG